MLLTWMVAWMLVKQCLSPAWWRLATMTENNRKPMDNLFTSISIGDVMGSLFFFFRISSVG